MMLQKFYIYSKQKIRSYWHTSQFYKPIYSSMWWSGEWPRQFVLISPTRTILLREIFRQNSMVDSDAIYGYNMGGALKSFLIYVHSCFIYTLPVRSLLDCIIRSRSNVLWRFYRVVAGSFKLQPLISWKNLIFLILTRSLSYH